VSTCTYGPLTLEQALREAFKDNEPLFGGRRLNSQLTKDLKVVIPVVSEFGKTIAFANYQRHRVPERKCASTSLSVYFTNVNYLYSSVPNFLPRRRQGGHQSLGNVSSSILPWCMSPKLKTYLRTSCHGEPIPFQTF
jgi:hypothetical protein